MQKLFSPSFRTTMNKQENGRDRPTAMGENCCAYGFPELHSALFTCPRTSRITGGKKNKVEGDALQKAISYLLEAYQQQQERDAVSLYAELRTKLLGFWDRDFGTVTVNEQCVMLHRIEN